MRADLKFLKVSTVNLYHLSSLLYTLEETDDSEKSLEKPDSPFIDVEAISDDDEEDDNVIEPDLSKRKGSASFRYFTAGNKENVILQVAKTNQKKTKKFSHSPNNSWQRCLTGSSSRAPPSRRTTTPSSFLTVAALAGRIAAPSPKTWAWNPWLMTKVSTLNLISRKHDKGSLNKNL